MGIVANYLPIRDAEVNLATGGDIDWDKDFDLQSRVRLDRKAVLQSRYRTDSNAAGLELRYQINGNDVRTVGAFTGSDNGTVLEIFPGSFLQHGTNNVEVEIVGGTGDVFFSDVLITYKVDD